MINQDLFCVLFLTNADSALSTVRRFEGKTPQGRRGHAQQAWAALRGKLHGYLRNSFRGGHYKMNYIKMTPGQHPDEFLNMMDSCQDRFNASSPPEGPMRR